MKINEMKEILNKALVNEQLSVVELGLGLRVSKNKNDIDRIAIIKEKIDSMDERQLLHALNYFGITEVN